MNIHRMNAARTRAQRGKLIVDIRSVPAPVAGWVSAQNLAAQATGTAIELINWFPTLTGCVVRGGNSLHATIDTGPEPVESFISYVGTTSALFASADGSIYDITSPADPEVPPTASVTGQTSDYYAHVNFTTSGGSYLYAVNGDDSALLYDGTAFYPITDTAIETLDYDTETGNFAVGETVTGGTSGASGVVVRVVDNGTDGTLYLNNIASGPFQNNETLTGSIAGSALADGANSAFLGAITGVDTSTFSHVNVYRNRLYFVEGGSNNVWYLGVDAITGAASSLSLTGIFRKGGFPFFTATWSMDAGDGLDDKLVVVSTAGEAAVFQGAFPGDAAWTLVGVYDITPPLGINAWFRAGGDLIIATEQGAVPISSAVSKDPAALSLDAVSRKIEPDWVATVRERRSLPWEMAKWDSRSAIYVNTPVVSDGQDLITFVVNAKSGSWAKYTGWDTRCLIVHNDQLYFGCNDGTVRLAEITGYDLETPYVAEMALAWDHLGLPGSTKTLRQARAELRTKSDFAYRLSASVDYTQEFGVAPNPLPDTIPSSDWDVGLWDVAQWDAGTEYFTATTRWRSIGRTGEVFSVEFQVPAGNAATPTAELAVIHLLYEQGGIAV